jgi:LuxR family quorum-sensing system transcriptional regulator CciR
MNISDECSITLMELEQRCDASHSLAELETLWRAQMNALGIKYAALGAHVDPLRPGKANYVFHTYPSAWIERFSRKNYQAIDPVYRATARGLTSFDWTDADFLQSLSWRQRRILCEAREFGLRFGRSHVLAPVLNLTASASLVADQAELDPAIYAAAKITNILVHNRATRICAANLSCMPILSRRERQCLELCASGLTDDEIAIIVRLSTHTVRRHIEAARARFGVSSRIQAATRAIGSGQIQPWN